MSSKRPRSDKHDKSKKPDPKAKPSNLCTFVSENARYKHSILCKKQIMSSRTVMINDFEHLILGQILRANRLEYFVSSKEQVYPNLVTIFLLEFDQCRERDLF